MPSPEEILSGLTHIANEWRAAAVLWHVYVAAMLMSLAVRRHLTVRVFATLLALPLLSVSALARTSHNPFNTAVCAALALALFAIAYDLPDERVPIGPPLSVLAGVALVTFGWIYPHFLETTHWREYLIAAPLGLLPCPTLSAIAGVTLIADGHHSKAWSLTLAAATLFYAVVGVFRLGVLIDIALLAGTAMLVITATAVPSRTAPRLPA
jgi:hypothetical protein